MAVDTGTEERALSLLASGLEVGVVANALGVDSSRISQLVSDPEFSTRLQELRFQNLQKHNERDASYDAIEDKLITRLDRSLAFITKPNELLNAIRVINQAKRRGVSAPEAVTAQKQVVQLVIPVQLMQRFTTNIHNQVISAGEQDLVTIGAKSLDVLSAQMKAPQITTIAAQSAGVKYDGISSRAECSTISVEDL